MTSDHPIPSHPIPRSSPGHHQGLAPSPLLCWCPCSALQNYVMSSDLRPFLPSIALSFALAALQRLQSLQEQTFFLSFCLQCSLKNSGRLTQELFRNDRCASSQPDVQGGLCKGHLYKEGWCWKPSGMFNNVCASQGFGHVGVMALT